jgi:hypothetical protein
MSLLSDATAVKTTQQEKRRKSMGEEELTILIMT